MLATVCIMVTMTAVDMLKPFGLIVAVVAQISRGPIMYTFEPLSDLDQVRMLCKLIIEEGASSRRRGRGAEMATEILRQLPAGALDDETYGRLKKWCEMRNRQEIVEGHFRQISRRLYGRSLERD